VPMDGGGEIVVRTTVDAKAREAVLDFTGSADQLPSNFNAPSAVSSRSIVACRPSAGAEAIE